LTVIRGTAIDAEHVTRLESRSALITKHRHSNRRVQRPAFVEPYASATRRTEIIVISKSMNIDGLFILEPCGGPRHAIFA
jgi:hypothetical protein